MVPKFKYVELLVENHVAYLILNRPAKLNALNGLLMSEVISASKWINEQAEIRVVVLKGAGKTFSAGADLASFSSTESEISWSEKRDNAMTGKILIDTIAGIKAITIAEVHGYAIGGAFLMVLACDFRYASDDAFFSIPEVDIGIPLAWGGIPRMVREFGPMRTKELVITCRRFGATEAFNLDMLNGIFPINTLADKCRKIAQDIARKPHAPVQITKEHVNSVADSMGDWGNRHGGADALMATMSTEEFKSDATAYVKRLKNRSVNEKG